MRLKIAYNNESRPGYKSGWGFSCYIEAEKRILFDTGDNGHALVHNLKKLGVDIADIDIIVLSHDHWDHTGGLHEIQKFNSNAKVYVLKSFSSTIKNEVTRTSKMFEIESPAEIARGIFTTGLINDHPDEQSLLLKTSKGIVVLVGCSHPGVSRILAVAERYGKAYALIGGLHGFSDYGILKDIEFIGACHCTQHIKEIRELFPDQFKDIKAGDVIDL